MPTAKTILITGGAGFIANALIARIADDNRIRVFDNFARDTLSSSAYADHPNLEVIHGDVLDAAAVDDAVNDADIVVHAAAVAGIDTVIQDPVQTMRVNMIGTANVLQSAQRHGVPDRVVVFSTSEVFGSMAFKSKEQDDTVAGSAGEARWTYAVSKLAGEHLASAYFRQFELPVVGVRPFNIYGPGQLGEGAIQKFITAALQDRDLHIHGDGNQIRAWCYVDDFIDGLLCCIDDPAAVGESFNIGNARAVTTIYGLAETVCRVLESKSNIVFKPAISADIELRIPSVDKAINLLGFRAQTDLEAGIRRTAEWVRSRL